MFQTPSIRVLRASSAGSKTRGRCNKYAVADYRVAVKKSTSSSGNGWQCNRANAEKFAARGQKTAGAAILAAPELPGQGTKDRAQFYVSLGRRQSNGSKGPHDVKSRFQPSYLARSSAMTARHTSQKTNAAKLMANSIFCRRVGGDGGDSVGSGSSAEGFAAGELRTVFRGGLRVEAVSRPGSSGSFFRGAGRGFRCFGLAILLLR
jgi:hypothetical protein